MIFYKVSLTQQSRDSGKQHPWGVKAKAWNPDQASFCYKSLKNQTRTNGSVKWEITKDSGLQVSKPKFKKSVIIR